MMQTLEWSALEYEERERSTDWFWALGVIVFAGSASAVIYNNYFFATIIIISGILLGFFAKKKPDMVFCELNEQGLKIRNRLYPYENIKSFWVQKSKNAVGLSQLKPILFIKSDRIVMPIITVPIEESHTEEIRSIMLELNVTEEEMKEHPSEKIMDFFGF